MAARTCGSLAADGRSCEPAQPSTSGFGAAAWDEAPQPVSASSEEEESDGGPHPEWIDHGRARLEAQRRMPVWPIE